MAPIHVLSWVKVVVSKPLQKLAPKKNYISIDTHNLEVDTYCEL